MHMLIHIADQQTLRQTKWQTFLQETVMFFNHQAESLIPEIRVIPFTQ